MAIAFCPDCEEPIHLSIQPKVGQRITCRSCGAELEVIETSPLELDWAYDGPVEDWDEDEEEEDEEWDDEEEDEEWDDEEEEEWDDEEDWDDEDDDEG
jgi:lysine biosynthesis protein LysW